MAIGAIGCAIGGYLLVSAARDKRSAESGAGCDCADCSALARSLAQRVAFLPNGSAKLCALCSAPMAEDDPYRACSDCITRPVR
jgi:hypothetical protein